MNIDSWARAGLRLVAPVATLLLLPEMLSGVSSTSFRTPYLLGAVVALAMWVAARRDTGWRFTHSLWVAAALWLATTTVLWRLEVAHSRGPQPAMQRLERAACDTTRRFTGQVQRIDRLIRDAEEHTRSSEPDDASFRERWRQSIAAVRLREDEGLALYDLDGTLLSWGGHSMAADYDLIAGAGLDHSSYGLKMRGEAAHLFAARRAGSGLVVVSEQHVDVVSLLGSFHPLDLPPMVSVEFLSNPIDRRAYGALFSRKKPFHRPHGAAGGAVLNFPLRTGDGSVVAVGTARDRSPRDLEAAITGRWQDLGVLGLAALILMALRRLLIGFPSLTGCGTVAGSSALLWGLRWMLSTARFPHVPFLQPLFDYRDYSSPLLGLSSHAARLFESAAHALHSVDRWTASPGDLFLTLAAGAAQAALLVAAAGRLPRRPRAGWPRIVAGWGAIAVSSLAAAGLLYVLVRSLTHDARPPLLDVDLHDPNRAALFLQMCLFAGAAALALGLLAVWRWAGRRCLGWRERRGFPALAPTHRLVLLGGIGVALVTLIYYPLLIRETEASRRSQIASLVLPRVQEQESRRELALRESHRKVLQTPDLAAELRSGPAGPALAYRIWARTELASHGYESSLRLVDAEGRVVSRFGLNVPDAFEEELRRSVLAGPGPGRARVRIGGIEKAVLFSRSTIMQNGELAGGVELVVPEGYDNIPFVFSPNPYTLLFRAHSAGVTRAALHGAPAHFSVYDTESHQSRFSTDPLTPPPLPSSLAARLAQGEGPLWRTVRHGRQRLQLLYAQVGNDIYAVGYQREGAVRLAAGWLQSTIQNLLFAAALALALVFTAAPAALRRAVRDWRLPGTGRTFYRRLLITLLLASLIPLIALTLFLEGLLAHEIRQEVQRLGSSALAVASRVVTEAALLTPGGHAKVDDNLLYWLSQVIRQDIHIYRGPDLEATSRRELFASGLLPERLSGEVERALGEERLPAVLLEERPGDERFYVISARLDLPPAPEGPWTLSLPLGLQQEEVEGKLREVREAVLLTIALLLLMLALLAYAAATRIARPLADLARAAGRLAGGDLEVRVERQAEAEIEALIDVFNRMARAIRAQQDDLRARRDYIEKILLNATTGVVSCDAGGRVVAVNPSARLLTGANLAPGRLLRPALVEVGLAALASLLPGAAAEGTQDWAAGVSERRQEIAVGSGQEERRLRAVLVPLRENERPAGGLLLLEDITETVRSNRLRAWAEMAQRIAHEIKNPLTPIQLSAEHLRHVYRDRPQEFGRVLDDCLRTITEQVHALRQLAREFSTYARIPEIKPERVDLREVVEETVGPYSASAPPGLKIERDWGDRPLPVRVDRALLRRALVNLLENSLEAMERKGTIRVRLHAGSENGRRQVTLAVDDNGPGIDAAILPRLFEPFFSTKGSGTGLGLAIARQAVEANGGAISVERPDSGRGTRMVITLPLADS